MKKNSKTTKKKIEKVYKSYWTGKKRDSKTCKKCSIGVKKYYKTHRSKLKGIHHSEERRKKSSKAIQKYYKTHKSKLIGIHRSKKYKKKISKAIQKYWKTHKYPMIGKHQPKSVCNKISKTQIGRKRSKKECNNVKKGMKRYYKTHKSKLIGTHFSKERKRKARLRVIKRMKLNGNQFASFNKKACEIFKAFDEALNTKGQYGGGEYYIAKLGYWLDYINFELKLIMEFDESYHYNNGKLKNKDIERQKEIQELFPDFAFRRIKDISCKYIKF